MFTIFHFITVGTLYTNMNIEGRIKILRINPMVCKFPCTAL